VKLPQGAQPVLAAFALGVVLPVSAPACTVCMGGPPSEQSRGLTAAIVGLLFVTYAIIAGMVAFAVQFRRRSRALAALPENQVYSDPTDRIHS
jgi:hypothetical protein